MSQEIVRVLRIIEYVGPRDRVEEVVSKSIHGTRYVGNGLIIRAATIGTYPEILTEDNRDGSQDKDDSEVSSNT